MRRIFALLLAVLMFASFATVAFAADSPVATKEYKITVTHEFGTPETVVAAVKDGNEYTLTAKEKEGYKFVGFEIEQPESSYEIVSKNGNTMVIRAKADLTVHAKYEAVAAAKPAATTGAKPVDGKATSPKTGDNTAMVVVMMLVAMCGVVVASKKLVRN